MNESDGSDYIPKCVRIHTYSKYDLEVIKLFSCSSAEREVFSANKFENANNSRLFYHIYKQSQFHALLCLARNNLQLLVM